MQLTYESLAAVSSLTARAYARELAIERRAK